MTVAFPGAEGFGANSVGGRGGTVYEVTNTNDSGTGSFREAAEASGARTVVFRTGGTITLTNKLTVTNPYLTIAGQTAPGGGICLKGSGEWDGSCLRIKTHNVIVRYIRVRQGAMTGESATRDGIEIGEGSHDVIIDHCSISWATDENLTIYTEPFNITAQWCIISEGLKSSTHSSGDHSSGVVMGGSGNASVSLHHNLFAHNDWRNPRISVGGIVDFVNNVIYNPGEEIGQFDNEEGNLSVNYVGNYVKKGGDSDSGDPEINISNPTGSNTYSIYVNGNIGPNRATDYLDESLVINAADRIYATTTRNNAPLVTTTSAAEALTAVLADAGANKTLSSLGVSSDNRDAVDIRIVADVKATTGSIIDDPSDVSGWPTLAAGTASTDTDSDGMPDDWENLYLLDPNDSSDNIIDENRDGYDNLEDYLNGVPLRQIDPKHVPTNTQTTANLTDSIRVQRSPR